MNIVAANESLTMSSGELAELIGIERKEANKKIRDMFQDEILREIISPAFRPNGQVDYYMLPEIESTMFVGRWHTPFLRQISQFWVQKKKNSQQFQIPQTLGEALQLAADQAKQLELAAPKVAFVDNLVDRTALMNATQVAQKHGKSAVWLNKILAELKVYNAAVKRGRAFQQWFIDKGLGEMKQSEEGYSQALFTAAGEVWINEKLHTEGIV